MYKHKKTKVILIAIALLFSITPIIVNADWGETWSFSYEIEDEEPFFYTYINPPSNSFGIGETTFKDINPVYWRNFLNVTNTWTLEKSGNGNTWEDCTYLLNIQKDYDFGNNSEKHTLSWVSDERAYYKLILETNASSLLEEYFEDGNRYLLNYTVFGDIYNTFFDWSDYLNSSEAGESTFNRIIKVAPPDFLVFEWTVTTNSKIPSGNSFTVDPTFGTQNEGADKWDGIDIPGGKFQMSASAGTADNITAMFDTAGGANNAKAALYKEDLTLVDNGITDQVAVTDGWYVFPFSTPPSLNASEWYYLVVFTDNAKSDLKYAADNGVGLYSDAGEVYATFPDPYAGDVEDVNGLASIYCSYTPTNNPPNAPTSPECDNQTNPTHVLDHTPYFDWVFSDPDAGATQGGFHIQVGNDQDWGTVEMWDDNESANGNNGVTYDGLTLLDGNTSYWRVKTKDNNGSWGPYCADQNFRMNSVPAAPTLDAPANSSIHMPYITESINISWSKMTDNESDSLNYRWGYAKDSEFTVENIEDWTGGDYWDYIPTAGQLEKETDYYWHVCVWDGLEYGQWSGWRTFQTDDLMFVAYSTKSFGGKLDLTNQPPVFSNENPTNQSTGVPITQATWSVTIEDPEGQVFTWNITVSDGVGTNEAVGDTNGSKSTNLVGLDYSTTYTVWVNATDGDQITNETFEFTTELAFTAYSTSSFGGKVEVQSQAIDVEINDTTWTIGSLACGEDATKNFRFYQNGTVEIDVNGTFNNTNFTFVSYSTWQANGYMQYCANVTNDSWATEINIEPKVDDHPITWFKQNLSASSNFTFGIRIWLPKTVSADGLQEDFVIWTVSNES